MLQYYNGRKVIVSQASFQLPSISIGSNMSLEFFTCNLQRLVHLKHMLETLCLFKEYGRKYAYACNWECRKHTFWTLSGKLFEKSSTFHSGSYSAILISELFSYFHFKLLELCAHIEWECRLSQKQPGDRVYLCVVGTECSKNWTTPFSSNWYQHKYHCTVLRYEISLLTFSVITVRANRSDTCNACPDLKHFQIWFTQGFGTVSGCCRRWCYKGTNCITL